MSENINSQITRLRKRMNITQYELAKAVGVTNQSVSKWESGICCPDIQLLPVLAKFFGVTIDELMGVSTTKEVTLQNVCNEYSRRRTFSLRIYTVSTSAQVRCFKAYEQ